MKHLLLCISLLALTACQDKPQFEAGDCVSLKNRERWEEASVIKIEEVGQRRYRMRYVKPEVLSSHSPAVDDFELSELIFEKVKCPKEGLL